MVLSISSKERPLRWLGTALIMLSFSVSAATGVPVQDAAAIAPERASGFTIKSPVETREFAVAAANPLATEAGYHIIQAGGSAIDAAIAIQAVLTLVEPQSSGIGGGAFLMYSDGQQVIAYDGRETAPGAVDENLFLDAKNNWQSGVYIPAYIRRYPFIFSEIPNSDQLTLCIDQSPNVIDDGGAQKFFNEDGKPSTLSQNALEFCKSYHAAAQATLNFSKALIEKELLVQKEVQINIANNRRINFSGFRILDEKKFAELDDATFLEWRAKGWLPFIYAHLFSGSQWQRLSMLLNERMEKEAA